MTTTYTPPVSPSFPGYPITLVTDGEPGNEESVNKVYRPIIDALEYLKQNHELDEGRLNALLTKLGLTVVDGSDTTLPTYSSGFLLTGNKSYQTALETLDTGIQTQNNKATNIDANVGGNVGDPGAPTYASGQVVFQDGDTHHEALEKLDDYAATNRALATTASSDATDALSTATNVAGKVGVDSELPGSFDYTNENIIADGDTLKEVVEKFDPLVHAVRRLADQDFGTSIKIWSAQNSADSAFYDTLIDDTKAHANTTATIDTTLFEAKDDGTAYFTLRSLPASHSQVKLLWNISGTVDFSVNLIGSFNDIDFTPVANEDVWVVPSSSGSSLVIRAEISGGSSRLFNIAALTKV